MDTAELLWAQKKCEKPTVHLWHCAFYGGVLVIQYYGHNMYEAIEMERARMSCAVSNFKEYSESLLMFAASSELHFLQAGNILIKIFR